MKPIVVHVKPVNDLSPHRDSADCPCRPRVEQVEGGGIVVVHNSFDGREITERAVDEIDSKLN